jgi:hypothetical protein
MIQSGGNVGIGVNPSSKLDVAGDINATGMRLQGVSVLQISGSVGNPNFAVGPLALASMGGANNTAVGLQTLARNSSGGANTAVGVNVLQNNNSGSGNTGTGFYALFNNSTGSGNTASGASALRMSRF